MTNQSYAADQIAANFTGPEFTELKRVLDKLDKVLYKSWAKDLSLNEIRGAVDMVEIAATEEEFLTYKNKK